MLVTALRGCVGEHPEDWDRWLPTVLLGYRSSVQASTKYSPFFMLYARQPVLPVQGQLLPQAQYTSADVPPEDYARLIMQKATAFQNAIPNALANIQKAQEKQKRDYRAKRKHAEVEAPAIQPGDYVVIRAGKRGSNCSIRLMQRS